MELDTMQAAICTKYGPPEVLKIVTTEKPSPGRNELLIKVYAASLNSGDVRVRGLAVDGFLRFVMRLVLGFNKPRRKILGHIYAGVVEKVGGNVKLFRAGDMVYGSTGMKFGTFAEYVVVSEKSVIIKKPEKANFSVAAALPFGVLTAAFFYHKYKIHAISQAKILIYGATGAVGTAAIQVAKYYDAEVTAVCSESGEEVSKNLGADKIVLYTKQDVTELEDRFDFIFDAVGKTKKNQMKHLLKAGGKYVTVGGLEVAKEKNEQLTFLNKMFEEGKYIPVIDRIYNLNEIVEANRYVDSGRKKGNVVIKVREEEK